MNSIHEMQRALELAHYARRHRGQRFVVALGGDLEVGDFLFDLKLLTAYGLDCVVVLRAQAGRAAVELAEGVAEGVPWECIAASTPGLAEVVAASLAAGKRPMVLAPDPSGQGLAPAKQVAAELAAHLGARRLILLLDPAAAALDAPPHLGLAEARARSTSHPLWPWVAEQLGRGTNVVLLPGRSGAVFEELFTHAGCGVLIGEAVLEEIRPATLADSADVWLMLKSDMDRGLIRGVEERTVRATIQQHLVYTIDGLVVGTARLVPHEDEAELSRFATLPRYRGRGRARELGLALIEQARQRGHQRVFALSIGPRMWSFFESLGLQACARETLPASWAEGYDFERPSRAYAAALASSAS